MFEDEFILLDAVTYVSEEGVHELIPSNDNDREEIMDWFEVGQTLTLEDVAKVRAKLAYYASQAEIMEEACMLFKRLHDRCKEQHGEDWDD